MTKDEKNASSSKDQKKKQKVFYHYCSLDTMDKILTSATFYLSDPLKMNDKKELIWTVEKLDGSTLEWFQVDGLNPITKEDLYNYLNDNINDKIFVGSFSYYKDDLSQWRGYGDDGRGVALGFELDSISANKNVNLIKSDVLYAENKVVMNKYKKFASKLYEYFEKYNIVDGLKKQEVFINRLVPYLATVKNPTFKSEKERRIIYFERSDYVDKDLLDHHYRVINGNNITEYVVLDIQKSSLKEIIIGPNCMVKKDFLEKYLKDYDYNAIVKDTSSTYSHF